MDLIKFLGSIAGGVVLAFMVVLGFVAIWCFVKNALKGRY